MQYRQIVITTIVLLLFAVMGTALVAYTYDNTRDQIAANERADPAAQTAPPDRA